MQLQCKAPESGSSTHAVSLMQLTTTSARKGRCSACRVKLLYPDCVRSHVTLFVYAPYGDELPYFHKHYAVLFGVITRRSGVNTTSSVKSFLRS